MLLFDCMTLFSEVLYAGVVFRMLGDTVFHATLFAFVVQFQNIF